jgi:hypothetical protein
MRLSEVLSRAPDTSKTQIEGFLGYRRVGWGQHRSIHVGMVIRNYFCHACGEIRTFLSGDVLSCLVTGSSSVSIDVALRCSACKSPMEAWFLVGCDDDMFCQAPVVHLERYTENRRDASASGGLGAEKIDDMLERAQVAFEDRLGAGAMIYLRKIFEMTTSQAAAAVGISITRPNGKRKTFRDLLEEVDEDSHIIPAEFSNNRYTLFSELSEVIHEDSDEAQALSKYGPCRKLVVGVVTNIRNNQEMAQAITSLGWNVTAAPLSPIGGASS